MALPPLGPSSINDQAPVPKAAGPARRARLARCRLSADTLKLGLGLLGILSLERMWEWGSVGGEEFNLRLLGYQAGIVSNQ